ncbi:MAG: adenine phosphoribosyltransferase [Candidatus Sumerlaeaceae bacterium]
MELKDYIRDVPDFPKPGILFKDITTLLRDGAAFHHTIDVLSDRYRGRGIQRVVGIEARGFIFASALAYAMGIGMVPVRKVGKLPSHRVSQTYDLEYGTDCVEIHSDAIENGEKVLVVDDLIATGGTLAATCDLIEQVGGVIEEVACIIELTFLPWKEKLGDRKVFTLVQY